MANATYSTAGGISSNNAQKQRYASRGMVNSHPPPPNERPVMTYGDWRDTKAAITDAYGVIGETHKGDVPERDWKLVDAALTSYRDALQSVCIECKTVLPVKSEIRCLDCKAPLCETCAPKHFWPNGRPRSETHK